jgi:hypothetical protein
LLLLLLLTHGELLLTKVASIGALHLGEQVLALIGQLVQSLFQTAHFGLASRIVKVLFGLGEYASQLADLKVYLYNCKILIFFFTIGFKFKTKK